MIQVNNQGMHWATTEPPEEYMFQVMAEDGTVSEWKRVSDCEEGHVGHLLKWMYNHYIHFVPGNDVVIREELIYIVKNTCIKKEPEWSAQIECFSIWQQQRETFTFKLVSVS